MQKDANGLTSAEESISRFTRASSPISLEDVRVMKKEEERGEKAERGREKENETERDESGWSSKLERISMKARRWMHFQLTDSLMDKPVRRRC